MDYVTLFVNSKIFQTSPFSALSLIFITMCRIIPVIALAPFFGARILPHTVKVAFSLCLATIILPKLCNSDIGPLPFNTTFFFLVLKELFIGFVMGFFLGLPFLIVSSSGVHIDHQRVAASLMTNDPTVQNQSSPIGTLYNLVLIVLFFAFNGPFYVVEALLDSYDLVPPDKFLSPVFFTPTSLLYERIVKELHIFVEMMLKLAMPGLLVILMTDTFLGIINRLAPQVQITFLGMGLKSWLAILIVALGWAAFVDEIGVQIIKWLEDFLKLIQEFAYGNPTHTSS